MKETIKRKINIMFKDQEYPVEIDVTPSRHEHESFEQYKERQKLNAHFIKMGKTNFKHKSLSHIEKILGKKGVTYKKEQQ